MSEIILGVGGGIAAYKSCELLRRLQDLGHQVTVIPTPSSLNFVGRATWEALSGRPVHTEVWEAVESVNHVKLGDTADYIIVAPATADLIARIAAGRADDLLTNSILASAAPKFLIPAMHPKMWLNPVTQENIENLRKVGFHILEPEVGRLTGKDSGIGRFPEVAKILDHFQSQIAVSQDLKGVKILVTAGGTREQIDEVRFIGNRSSGKQGLAIAKVAKARGAEVTLIAVNVDTKAEAALIGAKIIDVIDTDGLAKVLAQEFAYCQVLIMAAAVSDAKPIRSAGKIKKENYQTLNLEQTPDLLAQLSQIRQNQFMVGFAAEERANLLQEGGRKLAAKGLDLIYANDINQGQIFGSDSTSGFILDAQDRIEILPTSKEMLASRLLDIVSKRIKSPNV